MLIGRCCARRLAAIPHCGRAAGENGAAVALLVAARFDIWLRGPSLRFASRGRRGRCARGGASPQHRPFDHCPLRRATVRVSELEPHQFTLLRQIAPFAARLYLANRSDALLAGTTATNAEDTDGRHERGRATSHNRHNHPAPSLSICSKNRPAGHAIRMP